MPLSLSPLSLLHGLSIGILESEGTGRDKVYVEVLVAYFVDAWIGVRGDFDALEFKEESLGEAYVVHGIRHLDLIFERAGRGRG